MPDRTWEQERDAFLADGGYPTIEAWALDSEYERGDDGQWYSTGLVGFDREPVDIDESLHAAMEASGWFGRLR